MSEAHPSDWNPRSEAVLGDQIAAYDAMRRRCPVAFSDYLQWSLFRHADVMRALLDHDTFSNAVTTHLSVPNGMDPPLHMPYRRINERYFTPGRMAAFEPACRRVAAELVASLPAAGRIEWMAEFAEPFALRIQCAFMGWPATLHEPLRQWVHRNRQAVLAGDRDAMASVAFEFDGYITSLLDERRAAASGDSAGGAPHGAADDPTTGLLRERIDGRPLADDEIVSIVRNWTVGELSTIAACVGILADYLAHRSDLQQQLRTAPALLPAAIDEVLRIHAPLISNRRVTTCPVRIGGRDLDAGARVSLIWASANRDEAVFGDPDEFRLDRDPADNLLYGAGIHVCPGAPLARMELRVLMEELLGRIGRIEPAHGEPPVRAVYPSSGFSSLPLRVERAAG